VPVFAICFALGTLVFHRLSQLPSSTWLALELVLLAVLLWIGGFHRRRGRGTLATAALAGMALVAGFTGSHVYGLWQAPPLIPGNALRVDTVIDGTVLGLPTVQGRLTRIVVAARVVTIDDRPIEADWRFRVTWQDAPQLLPGERWSLPVRLKLVSGYATPGAWDYEGWLYHQGIRYTGYVRGGENAQRLTAAPDRSIDRVRAAISTRLASITDSPFSNGVLRALVVADRSGLDRQTKALFRDTGTSHLMAVSGLHIGLVSGVVMLITALAWRRVPALCARLPARLVAGGAGIAAAAVYAALAGFGLPTQRALIMLAVFVFGILWRRETRALHSLSVAAVLVLAWHPPSIVDAGFWLSFGAVAAILAALAWTRSSARWVQAVAVQGIVTLALAPLLLVHGLPVSAVSPLVNLVLVPLFGVLIVPISLLGGLLSLAALDWAGTLLAPLAVLLDLVETALQRAAEWTVLLSPPPTAVIWLLATGLMLSLAPPGIPLRWVGLPVCLLALVPRAPAIGDGDFRFHLLDVGQGLSAVIETRRHVLVFDTGPAYPSGFSTAEAVLVPFLGRHGHRRIDRLVVSHADSDHGGGTAALLQAIAVDDLLSGEPAELGHGARRCAAGMRWAWDGVQFAVLHPAAAGGSEGNNASCVLRVGNRAGSVLLTGDIEASVERRLVAADAAALQATVVVAPHHGSASSSTQALIDQVDAEYVLFPAGWANRYGFPHPDVVHRWTASGVAAHHTALSGTLSFRFHDDGRVSGPVAHRIDARRFWSRYGGSADHSLAVSSRD
jgi:competence protein ComEC